MKKLKFRNNDGSSGSITVLVTLILVPTIFLNAFMVDLARLKLYGDQAAMTADNYGEAVLSVYDNILKDLYGLFAVSNTSEGIKALEELEKYVPSSFDPNKNSISWSHLGAVLGQTTYSGFMPYQSAEVTLSRSDCAGANLANEDVLSTQIGDFMRFRIGQALKGQGSAVIEALETIKNSKADSKAIDQKNDFDEVVGNLLEKVRRYYEALEIINKYSDYLKNINSQRSSAVRVFQDIGNSDSWRRYYDYMSQKSSVDAAVNHRNNLKKNETLSDEEVQLCQIYDEYAADPEASRSSLESKMNAAIDSLKTSFYSQPIDFSSFDSTADELKKLSVDIFNLYNDVSDKQKQLEQTLNSGGLTESVKEGIEKDIETVNKLFVSGSVYSTDTFIKLADHIQTIKIFNRECKSTANDNIQKLESIRDAYLRPDSTAPSMAFGSAIDTNRYEQSYNFRFFTKYNELYQNLKDTFGSTDGSNTKKAESKKKDAENAKKDAENELKQDETSDARDIPASFGMGSDKELGEFTITRLIKTAASYLDAGSISEGFNDLLLKFYTVEYDFSMFSNRTTNIDGEDDEQAVSLTGYRLCKEINYLYGAELEYLFGGFNSSDKNLTEARNKILAFRAVTNYASTYKIAPINKAIRAIADLASAVNPLLGVGVAAALRLGITAMETAADWKELKKGGEVVVLKGKVAELTLVRQGSDAIQSLLGDLDNDGGDAENAFKLDYENYLMVLIVFLTTDNQVTKRTGDLISLNVNTVEQNIGASGTLSKLTFEMSKAVTAVKTTCSVHLDFVVIPDAMAKSILSGDDYDTLTSNEKNVYSFTVTRGY